MLQFENSFFEDEVREGFFVPAMIKKAWAAELTVMHEVDRICRKHDIPYFTDWGTMLGAVRHGGFIPWDDDFDIMMRRKDYEHFLQLAQKELPEGFAVLNMDRTENFWYFLARVTARPQICFEEEHLKQFHGFPYIAGIDIFILDTMSSDAEQEKQRETVIEYILALADSLGEKKLEPKQKEIALRRIEKICQVKIKRSLPDVECRRLLYQLVQRLMTVFEDDREGNYVQLIPHAVYRGNTGFPQNYYKDGVRISFENIEVMLPVRYETILQKKYGNYMQLIRSRAGHDYPFFRSQKEQLEKILGYQLPRYQYRNIQPRKNTEALSYKYKIKEHLYEFERLHEEIRTKLPMAEALIKAQENAIEMGNLIERIKGEDHPIIRRLEHYCEAVFELYNAKEKKQDAALSEQIADLEQIRKQIEEDTKTFILQRKEVVFLPFGGKYWAALHSVWEAAAAEPDCDVYVVPLPYYYKEYDGSFLEMAYDLSEYPEYVPVIDYQEFDLALHHPDMIFIQNPYDEWNSVTSIPKEFYSSVIRNYTESLIYIPYFQVEEFKKENEREYWNMNYYCTVPGVVNADKVIVQSENMKQLYVDKLSEFAGEDTREIWKQKIMGIGSPILDSSFERRMIDAGKKYPREWNQLIRKQDGERKQLILFHVSMSGLIQYQEKMLQKIRQVFDVALENEDEVVFVWKEDPMIDLNQKAIGKKLYEGYRMLQEKIVSEHRVVYAERVDDQTLAAVCDGYYGMPSATGNRFQVLHKPVMIVTVQAS